MSLKEEGGNSQITSMKSDEENEEELKQNDSQSCQNINSDQKIQRKQQLFLSNPKIQVQNRNRNIFEQVLKADGKMRKKRPVFQIIQTSLLKIQKVSITMMTNMKSRWPSTRFSKEKCQNRNYSN